MTHLGCQRDDWPWPTMGCGRAGTSEACQPGQAGPSPWAHSMQHAHHRDLEEPGGLPDDKPLAEPQAATGSESEQRFSLPKLSWSTDISKQTESGSDSLRVKVRVWPLGPGFKFTYHDCHINASLDDSGGPPGRYCSGW
jgi:hypothetical protein